jgi:hypothetical protein
MTYPTTGLAHGSSLERHSNHRDQVGPLRERVNQIWLNQFLHLYSSERELKLTIVRASARWHTDLRALYIEEGCSRLPGCWE